MPVIVKDTSGRRLRLVLRNVRLVPGFKYTLLSVRQLWNEQRISSQFDDTNSLVINTVDGVVRIPFAPSAGLPLVHLVSDTTNSTGGDPATGCRALSAEAPASEVMGSTRSQTPAASSRYLGFHRVGASSHIARLPAAQAAELIHRRCLLGVDKLRAAPHTTADAPRVLASATAVPPSAAVAAARIRRAPSLLHPLRSIARAGRASR